MSETNEIMDPFEDCPSLRARDLMKRLGYVPLKPEHVDDAQLTGRLWEFIYALAGRRFYLYHTDHLSDRELYIWLHDQWLSREVQDVPYEAEWNCRVSPGESDDDDGAENYLRYYAGDEEREQWAADFPDFAMPEPQKPLYDRDRWLPVPPYAASAMSDEVYPAMEEIEEEEADEAFELDAEEDADLCQADSDEEEEEAEDYLGLGQVDREIRAQKAAAAEPNSESDYERDAGPAMSENWERPRDVLARAGVRLLPPDELTDETIPGHLWELLHNLACRGFYVQHTDHLNDRQLYTELWEHGLTDLSLLPGRCQAGAWFHDVIGSYGPADVEIWLQYYANEIERANHARENPERPIPAREQPVALRDWRLPKGPF